MGLPSTEQPPPVLYIRTLTLYTQLGILHTYSCRDRFVCELIISYTYTKTRADFGTFKLARIKVRNISVGRSVLHRRGQCLRKRAEELEGAGGCWMTHWIPKLRVAGSSQHRNRRQPGPEPELTVAPAPAPSPLPSSTDSPSCGY